MSSNNYLPDYRDKLGSRRFANVYAVKPGELIQFNFKGEMRIGMLLAADYKDKMHVISLKEIPATEFTHLIESIHPVPLSPIELYNRVRSMSLDFVAYRQYFHKDVTQVQRILPKKAKIEEQKTLTPEQVKLFNDLAAAQRGEPEMLMTRLQITGAELYGWVAEHVGDLTHRMSKDPLYLKGDHYNVSDKVQKTLRSLTSGYGFVREITEQANGAKLDLTKLKTLAKNYSDAHAKLKVYNQAQWRAREAAVSYGAFDFAKAIEHLRWLKSVTDKGRDAWAGEALKFDPTYRGP